MSPKTRWFLIGFMVLIASSPRIALAKEIILFGKDGTYANKNIIFFKYSDFITSREDTIGHCVVDDDGNFEIKFNLKQTTYIFSHLGIYHAFLYAEPGKSYELIMPEYVEKKPADKLNPYFEETILHFATKNQDKHELNVLIRMFGDSYNPYYQKHVKQSVTNEGFQVLDKDISEIENNYKQYSNKYFKEYRKYRYAMLRFIATQYKITSIDWDYYQVKPVLYNNTAYMELFNKLYDKYFQYHSRTENGKKIFNDINNNKNLHELKITLRQNNQFKNDSLIELVILKNIFNEYYSDKFSRSGLIVILDSLIERTNISVHKKIGENIRKKITQLQTGYPPPKFKLMTPDSNMVSLKDFKGKYVYLNFCICYSYSCLSDFVLLNDIYQRHKDYLEIVTISTDPYLENLNKFLKKNNYNWTFLYYGEQPQILSEYDIRAFPTYFLIDREGKLVFSPAPTPNEGFEAKFIRYKRNIRDF